MGVVCVAAVFIILIMLPFLDFGSVQGLMFRPLFLIWF
jgi:quinol-cytochrome oxidoreductase complex cytochrome b subunit